jgi:NAD(P)-dependent dehydrogenase (short-subunit alcohol dehydrogenase family)
MTDTHNGNPTQFAGKTVIVTGAAGGLGRAFAEGFAARGANIVVADMNEAGSAETVALVEKIGAKAIAVTTNVTDKASTDALMDSALAAFGSIDVVINNAALYATINRAPFYELDPDEWDRVMAVNVKGAWLVSASAFPKMTQATGRIIHIASATVFSGSPLWMHYVASKGAMIGMTRVMAREVGKTGVTVNAIAPGFTLTEASLSVMDDAETYGVSSRAIPRASQPGDMVGTALFLASEDASYITGQTIIVDGGKEFI